MASLFLAYAVGDQDQAERVRDFLAQKGFDLWDASQISAGTDWQVSILDRLRDASAIIVLTSKAAARSEWIRREIEYTQISGKPIIPLVIDGAPLPELADLQHVKINPDGSVPDPVIAYLRGIVQGTVESESGAAHYVIKALSDRTISSVVDEVQSKVVLLLGNFNTQNVDRLTKLQAALEGKGLHPIIFNFDRPKSADYGETIRLLAGLSGFVVAEMSDPRSVAMELQLIAPLLSVPIVPLLSADQKPLALFGDFFGKYDWVLPTHIYPDLTTLIDSIEEIIIAPARQKREELNQRKAAARDTTDTEQWVY